MKRIEAFDTYAPNRGFLRAQLISLTQLTKENRFKNKAEKRDLKLSKQREEQNVKAAPILKATYMHTIYR